MGYTPLMPKVTHAHWDPQKITTSVQEYRTANTHPQLLVIPVCPECGTAVQEYRYPGQERPEPDEDMDQKTLWEYQMEHPIMLQPCADIVESQEIGLIHFEAAPDGGDA